MTKPEKQNQSDRLAARTQDELPAHDPELQEALADAEDYFANLAQEALAPNLRQFNVPVIVPNPRRARLVVAKVTFVRVARDSGNARRGERKFR